MRQNKLDAAAERAALQKDASDAMTRAQSEIAEKDEEIATLRSQLSEFSDWSATREEMQDKYDDLQRKFAEVSL